jgi:hypothetical protein
MAYAEEVQLAEAWYEFNTARLAPGLQAGLRQLFSERDGRRYLGNIITSGRARPRRPSGYNWSSLPTAPPPPWSAGLHPASTMQVLNLPQGHMQNCNISPDVMMVDSRSRDKTLS